MKTVRALLLIVVVTLFGCFLFEQKPVCPKGCHEDPVIWQPMGSARDAASSD